MNRCNFPLFRSVTFHCSDPHTFQHKCYILLHVFGICVRSIFQDNNCFVRGMLPLNVLTWHLLAGQVPLLFHKKHWGLLP